MKIKIAVATHKTYKMPSSNIYIPVEAGAYLNDENLNYQGDNSGINISEKNRSFCELTVLYWLWKNSSAEYKGLVHYRRHFSKNRNERLFSVGKFENILDEDTLMKHLSEYDIIVPKKRKYYIETIKSHYEHTHYSEDLVVLERIIRKDYPEYLNSYEKILNKKSAHMFNMFIMKNEYFDSYCSWLFSIVFELEKELDISNYSMFHSRVFGRLSEILLDVWIEKKELKYYELPVMFMEDQNWIHKITKFLKAKFKYSRY